MGWLQIEVLKHTDNRGNFYDNSSMLAALLQALGRLRMPDSKSLKQAVHQLDRFLARERVLPSYHSVVAQAALQAFTELALAMQGSAPFQTRWAAPGKQCTYLNRFLAKGCCPPKRLMWLEQPLPRRARLLVMPGGLAWMQNAFPVQAALRALIDQAQSLGLLMLRSGKCKVSHSDNTKSSLWASPGPAPPTASSLAPPQH